MPKYAYVAVGADGATARGVRSAASLSQARQELDRAGMTVQRISEHRGWAQLEITGSRMAARDLMHLSRQLGAFLRAGIPILEAIRVLGEESDRPAVRRVLAAVGEDLRGGATLSQAVDAHPRDVPEWYRGILRSAELTGRLDDVLDQLALYLERDVDARRKIRSALLYPAMVATMALGTILVLSVYVLPKFEGFFDSLDAEVPTATRILLATTRFLGSWWWLIATCLAVLAGLCLLAVRTARGRLAWHRLLLAVPVVGEAVRYSRVERFTRLLASMVSAGVPLPQAMSVATSSLGNLVFQRALEQARTALLQGAGLARPVSATRLFPGVAAQMIRVGEDTGTLDTQLELAARYYERELDYKIQKVTGVIEPVVVVGMGSIVGFVAVALVSAMYDIFRTANLG